MKPRTPGFWLIVATVGLLALLPMQALAGMSPEEVKLFRETKTKADQGNLVAQNSLGLCYYFGRGVAKDYVQAVNLWRKGANQGDAYAQHLLAHRYATGEGVAKDSVQAVNLWRKSADQGNAKAQFELGNSYATGTGVAKNEAEAVAWFRKAAEQWFVPAQFQMGLCYANGAGVTKDEIEACAYWNLIKVNYPLAQSHLASLEMKMAPEARTRGRKRAEELIHENESKQVGKPQSYADEYRASERERLSNPRNLKVLLEAEAEALAVSPYMKSGGYTGPGASKELQAIVQSFDFTSDGVSARYRAAQQQMYQITMLLQREWEKGFVKESERESAEAMIKAHKGDAAAQFVIGKGYYRTSKTRDYENALKWLLKSAEQGNRQAQAELGECYLDVAQRSSTPEQAMIESAKWYRVAAEAGDAKAQYGLSRVYNKGRSTEKDTEECVKWLRLSAAQGYVPAQTDLWHKLEDMAYTHTPLTQKQIQKKKLSKTDYVDTTLIWQQETLEMLKWSRQLADHGDTNAMNHQGYAYHEGKFVAKDEAAALKWHRMAAEAGDERMQGLLWSLYSTGKATYFDPVPVDEVEAMKWCRILAANRNAEAIYAIGDCYAEGRGVPQSNVEAYAYWTASLLRWGSGPGGDQTEPAKRLELRAKMSAAELAAAQKRSGEILTDLQINSMKKQAQFNAEQLQQSLDYR